MSALRAVRQSGLLGPHPVRALWQFLRLAARHGPSLYTVAAWSAARFPDRAAVVEGGTVTTFRELLARTDAIADVLAARIPPGATVGLLGRNRAAFVAWLLATQRARLRAVLLNMSFPATQTLDLCRSQNVSLLLADDDFLPDLLALDPKLPCCSTSDLEALVMPRPRAGHRGASGIVILSSGSTGTPKAVRRSLQLREMGWTVPALIEKLALRAHAPTLLTTPLFHGHGLSTLALSLALAAPLHLSPRGTPEAYWQIMRGAGIEVLVLVPTVLHRLLETPHHAPLPRLRTIVCGSAPLGAALAGRALARFGPVLHNLYGTSEAGLMSLASPEDLREAPGGGGELLPGVKVRVLREDGTPAPRGEVGEIVVRTGPPLARTDVRTGDLGRLDASGHLTLAGRRDDVLICGGEKILPEEIEARISSLPYVRECAVIGVPSEEYGQLPAAFVVLRPNEDVTRNDFDRDLRALLPRRWRPADVTFVPSLPRNALGKLVRRQLRPGEELPKDRHGNAR